MSALVVVAFACWIVVGVTLSLVGLVVYVFRDQMCGSGPRP